MARETVITPYGEAQVRDLTKPTHLRMSMVNQLGVNLEPVLLEWGFEPLDQKIGKLGVLVRIKTPKKILDRTWGLYYQDNSQDRNLFTVCIQAGDFYQQLFRQIQRPQSVGGYCLFVIF